MREITKIEATTGEVFAIRDKVAREEVENNNKEQLKVIEENNRNQNNKINENNNIQNNNIDNFKIETNNNIDRIENKVNNSVSGSPGGVYDNIEALIKANPDHNKIYITSDNGNWNYWNGSTFISGGIYQAKSIGNNTIVYKDLNKSLSSNFYKNYENINDALNPNFTGYIKNNDGYIQIVNVSDFKYNKIKLEKYTNYLYYGYNLNNIVINAFVADSSNKIIESTISGSLPGRCTLNINTKNEDYYLYINLNTKQPYQKDTMKLYKLNSIFNVNINNIMLLNKVPNYLMNFSQTLGNELIINYVDPAVAQVNLYYYKMQKGFRYKIKSQNYGGMLGASLIDNNYKLLYKSSDVEVIGAVDFTYEFNAVSDGFIILGEWINRTNKPSVIIEDRITELENKIIEKGKEFTDKKWGLVGDSITENNWRATKHYWNYIKDKTGIELDNVAVSGVGYSRGGINSIPSQISKLDNDCDIVTIFAGVNDIAWIENANIGLYTDKNTESIMSKVNETIDNLENKFKGKIPIIFITPLPSNIVKGIFSEPYTHSDLYPASLNNNMTKFVNELKKLCEYRGYPILNLYNNSNLMPQINECKELYFKAGDERADGLHPNALGHKFIYNYILNILEKYL